MSSAGNLSGCFLRSCLRIMLLMAWRRRRARGCRQHGGRTLSLSRRPAHAVRRRRPACCSSSSSSSAFTSSMMQIRRAAVLHAAGCAARACCWWREPRAATSSSQGGGGAAALSRSQSSGRWCQQRPPRSAVRPSAPSAPTHSRCCGRWRPCCCSRSYCAAENGRRLAAVACFGSFIVAAICLLRSRAPSARCT